MIDDCHTAGLPEPTFEQNGAHFVTTIWRDWLTDTVMNELGMNERQKKGVGLLRETGLLTSRIYQESTGVSRQTSSRDLDELVQHGILIRHGERKGTY